MSDFGERGVAVYAEGGLTQVILVGVDGSSQMTQGQFKLRCDPESAVGAGTGTAGCWYQDKS